MGSGLTRAAQATARSRWDGSLTPEMRSFLGSLAPFDHPRTRGQIGCVVTKAEVRARRRCSALGLTKEATRESDGKVGWQITAHGRSALEREGPFATGAP